MENPIFVVGCPRSGTTLLRLMLASHSHIGIPPEGTFISDLYAEFGGIKTISDKTITDFVGKFFAIRKCREWLLHREPLTAHLTRRRPTCYADLIHAVYEHYLLQRQPGRRRWGDKNPIYVTKIPLLHAIFPQAKFVHIIRDGRDVAISHRHPAFNLHSVKQAAQLWRERVTQGHLDGMRLGETHYIELRYEDLCLHPKRILKKLCDFCDIPFEYQNMMKFYKENDKKCMVPLHRHAWHSNTFRPLNTDRISIWQREMKTDDVLNFQKIAGDVLEKFGYDMLTPSSRSTVTNGIPARKAQDYTV
jgi:hypothetical protein